MIFCGGNICITANYAVDPVEVDQRLPKTAQQELNMKVRSNVSLYAMIDVREINIEIPLYFY